MGDFLNINNIPDDLKEIPHWVCYNLTPRENSNGKYDKKPINALTGAFAKSNDPATWCTFTKALKSKELNGFSGIGFMFGEGIFGIDIDDCFDVETGEMSHIAIDIISSIKSYTEISPSGRGIHIYCRGVLPEYDRRKGNIEMYSEGRFFTVTGDIFGDIKTIEDRTNEVKEIHQKYIARDVTKNTLPKKLNLTEQDILNKALTSQQGAKFKTLYSGDWQSGYTSQSEADIAFCNMLAFWCGCDSGLMDSIYRQSGLMRDKWDRAQSGSTYGQLTLQRAIKDNNTTYGDFMPSNDGYSIKFTGEQHKIPTKYTMDDTGNAQRYRDLHFDNLKWSYTNNCWYFWTGSHWVRNTTGEEKRKADEVIQEMLNEVYKLPDEERAKRMVWAYKTRSQRVKEAMVKEAKHLENMQIDVSTTDSRAELLNVKNGVIDLRKGELFPHHREYFFTRAINVDFDNTAECPTWERFLDDITQGDKQLKEFLQLAIGYTLTGSAKEQCIFICHGTGRNGKSTLIDIISEITGGYGMNCQPTTLMANRNASTPLSEIARLKGARFVSTTELDEGVKLNEALIKQITGGDKVTARFLYGAEFDFVPDFKIWMSTNHIPIVRGTDDGIWRRIRLIPFDFSISEEKKDKNLKFKLRKELQGILAWAVKGAVQWYKTGLTLPDKVKYATDEYRSDMDIIKTFCDECIAKGPGEIKAQDIYNVYRIWCDDGGYYKMSGTKFGREMSAKFKKMKNNNAAVYLGIRFNETALKLNEKRIYTYGRGKNI